MRAHRMDGIAGGARSGTMRGTGAWAGAGRSRGSAAEMTTFACAACTAAVPPGRLACPSCGELLASVAGRVAARPSIGRRATVADPEPPADVVAAGAIDPPESAALPAFVAPAVVVDVPAAPIPPTGSFRPGTAFASASAHPPIAPDAPLTVVPAPATSAPSPGPSWPDRPATPSLEDAQAAALARWAAVSGAASASPGTSPPAPAAPAARFDGLPALPIPVAERLVALAAGVVAVAFLLPWGDLVIGAVIVGEPWHRLGILAAWHWLAWLAALPVILLATAADRVPPWIRLGVVPIAYGGLVIGLAWPYVLGPIGGAPAPLAAVAASLALVVVGALAVRPAPDRP